MCVMSAVICAAFLFCAPLLPRRERWTIGKIKANEAASMGLTKSVSSKAVKASLK